MRNNRMPALMGSFPALFEGAGLNSELDNLIKSTNEILDRFWDNRNLDSNFFLSNFTATTENKFPKVNLQDMGDSYKVEIAVAGFDKDDVDLEFKDNGLYIKAFQNNENTDEDSEGNYVMREIAQRSFRRFVPLPEKVDKNQINDDCVSYNNGIITCTFPKQQIENSEETLKLKVS